MSGQEYLKKRNNLITIEQIKKLPSNEAINEIINFLQNLIKNFLKKFEKNIIAFVPINKIMFLKTSNILLLDEIINVTPVIVL